jgi:hypothetical protein
LWREKKNENLDQIMYAEDFFDGGKDDDDQDIGSGEEEVTGVDENKKEKRLSKGAKPREITKDGLLYYLIKHIFSKSYTLSVSLAQIQLW